MEKTCLGERIRERRKKLGLTAEQLAKKVGVDRTYISKIEKNNCLPSPEILGNIVINLKDRPGLYFSIYERDKYPKLQKFRKEQFHAWHTFVDNIESAEAKSLIAARSILLQYHNQIEDAKTSAIKKQYKKVLKKHITLTQSYFAKILENLETIEPERAQRLKEKYLPSK